MGVERTLAILQGKSIFETETFVPIIKEIEKISRKKYGRNTEETKAMRIIADHIKASVFILAEKIAKRQGIGNVLAEGVYRAALKIKEMRGVDVMDYAIHVKGIGIGAHGTRSKKDYTTALSYAGNVQGGDHTAVACLPTPGSWGDTTDVFMDSAVSCSFLSFSAPKNFKRILDFLNATTGWDMKKKEWHTITKRILTIQRVALLIGGPDVRWNPAIHDDNPKRFYDPLPSGPDVGEKTEKNDVEKLKKQYYEAVGWDENGIPKPEELEKLGLSDLIKDLDRIKK